MKRLLSLFGGAAAVAGLMLAQGATAPASATGMGLQGSDKRDCPTITCTLPIPDFGGGTISVDADSDGRGRATWVLLNKWGDQFCKTEFRLEDPPQSWNCSGLAGGNYRLTLVRNTGVDTHWAWIGARW
ncbi:hypothetical protein [Amycolatopsis sp. cmx-11-12]|uniref:hypothetical protein n=1 Tax=Amycolatopsis sp. cmx-11-12 TaxID=2785795 RepID=UPI003917C61C